MSWLTELTVAEIARKLRHRVLPNLRHMRHSRLRRCRCCERLTVFLALGEADEFKVCIRCKANLRYEMLAQYIRRTWPDLGRMSVLELDPGSPLRHLLSTAGNYRRSFYRSHVPPGTVREDGAVCEDIMRLTLPDASVDLIVSSDVLEHVPDPALAFSESGRVLRPGGAHVFTVPPRARTRQLARLSAGKVEQLVEPAEYHLDPLDATGVLVFWDYGDDLPQVFADRRLRYGLVAGPEGQSRRVIWEARRIVPESGRTSAAE